ncbi:hypothetical protein KUTeg_022440 [Tegillarca granosa]|uniref:Centrosomal protein of 192 kDa n=1 Tax=Tegillarca granosa TaxID=220873 RepID=A0ABQ9E676_TEGGR|nr:hypothetical protein KUTeg_022440 [Tegillarca granosa]
MVADDALNMLQNDEKEFEKENIFRQDDNMDPVETPDTSSWMYKSEMSVSCPPSMAEGIVGENKDLRISIGTYLMGRSGALGSLDGENDLPRVNSPTDRDLDIQTFPDRDHDSRTSSDRNLDTRTSGVGDEEGDNTVVDDKFSLSALEKTPTASAIKTSTSIKDSPQRLSPRDGNPEFDEVFSRPDETPAVKFIKNDLPSQGFSDKTWLSNASGNITPDTSYSPGGILPSNASLAENSGVLNVSELSRVISAASKDSNPAELANLILKLSSKHPSRSKESKLHRNDTKSVDGTDSQENTEKIRKNSDKISESVQKSKNTSRLPVRKGTNLNRSGRRTSSESDRKERGGEKMEQSMMTVSQLKKSVVDNISDNDREIFHKSKPDGEESEIEKVRKLQKKENMSASRNSRLEDSGNLKHHSSQKHRRPSHESRAESKTQNTGELVQDRGLMSGKTVTSKVLTDALDKAQQYNRGVYGSRNTSDRLHPQEMLPFSRENQPADGQASKLDKFSNPSTPPAVNQNLSHGGSKQIDPVGHLHVRSERSPRSSVNSLGLTGHHIPDGTEYADEGGVSRENLVGGTDDIDTADSRGFDLISDRQMMSRNQSGVKSNLPTNQMLAQKSEQSQLFDSGPINTQVTRSERRYKDELKQQEQNEVSNKTSMSPRESPDLHGQAEGRGTKELQYLKDTRDDRRFASSPKTTIYNQEKIPDELLMPPPPVPSFNHSLLPAKTPKSSAPLLLTKQSLLDTDFAREYLVRDAPGQLISKDTIQSYPHRGNQNDLNSLKTPGSRLSQFCMDPMYQSTPFTRAPTQSPPENTITTSSAMHSMMSTGIFEEMIPSQSVMHHHDNTTCTANKSMMPKKLTPVTAPGELRFGEVCCLGIGIKTMLPLTNPTGDWLECHLKIRAMSIDGQVARNQVFIPFELKNKVVIEPHKTEEIPIIFIPKVPGTYVAQLLIFSTLFLPKSSEIERIPTEVSLQAIAEKPNIKRQCTWDAYSFDPRYSPDVSVISQSCRLESPALRKIIKTFYLIGNDGTEQSLPREIKVYCCPKQTQSEKTLAQQPPHLMIARMDIEVDTPSSCIPIIDSLELKSVIGVQKLHIDNENIDGILVEAFPGKNGAKTITVVNAGNVNIDIKVSLEDDFGGIFRVCPDKIHLKVQERGFTVVEFLPNSAKIPTYDTILNLMIEPDGPYYDLSVRGNVVTEPRQGNPVLLADKHFLMFGGVALGSNREKRVIMMNKSSFPVKVRLDIPSSDFQMKSRQYPHYLSAEKDVIIKPFEKYPIYVQYTPSETTECYQKLRIKPQNSTFKYNVPLFGYGGTSNVVIEDSHVYDSDGKRYIDVGTITAGKTITIQLTLRNTGDRTAYIKSLVYTDNSCTKLLVNRCYVKPDEFLLPVDATTTVAVVFKPTEREAAFCSDRKDVVATIAFMYGDEQSRQRFRRALRDPKADLESVSVERTLRSVNFNVPYKDENLEKQAPTGPTEISAKGFISSFYSTMSSVHVSLVGQPSHPMNIPCRTPQLQRCSQTMPAIQNDQSKKGQHLSGMQTMPLTGASTHYSSVNSAVQDRHSYFPVKDSNQNKDLVSRVTDMPPMFYSTVYSHQTDHDWTVKPDSIIVYVPSKRDEQPPVTKLQIMNFKSVSLKFEILVPKGVNLEFTPENGTVEPKSSLTVCVSASATQKISNLPWRGAINISCNDVPKVVKVQMRTDILDDNSFNQPSINTSVPLYSQTSGQSYSQTSGQSSLMGQSLDLSKSAPGFMSTNTIINFPATKVCEMSETTFNLENPSNNEINWIISSFAPPYVKEGPDSTKTDEVFRANYKVFDFNKRFGHLQPGKSIQLQIQFMPRSVGKFSQHWEIGIQMMKDEIPASLLHLNDVKDSVPEKKNLQVVLADNKIDFPDCEVGQTQICKVRLKNESSAPHTVEVIKPRSPFHIRHIKFEIKPRRYLHFPVHFKPETVGSYEGIVVFRVDVGYHLSLKLEGECKAKTT